MRRLANGRLSNDEFLERCFKIHGDKYDYSKTNYENNNKKVTITCKIHGDFIQAPFTHLDGSGCQQCGKERQKFSVTKDMFLEKVIPLHGDKYDYSLLSNGVLNKYETIICDVHGEIEILVKGHMKGTGCVNCSIRKAANNRSLEMAKEKTKHIKQPTDYKIIGLTQNMFTKVSNEDFDVLKDINWHFDGRYARTNNFGRDKKIRMHTFLLNPEEGFVVDHINGDTLDNRRDNLRVCTQRENLLNSKAQTNSKYSKFKGLCFYKHLNKYVVNIGHNGVNHIVGYFTDEIEAAKAYDKKAKELFGEFAYLNFPDDV